VHLDTSVILILCIYCSHLTWQNFHTSHISRPLDEVNWTIFPKIRNETLQGLCYKSTLQYTEFFSFLSFSLQADEQYDQHDCYAHLLVC